MAQDLFSGPAMSHLKDATTVKMMWGNQCWNEGTWYFGSNPVKPGQSIELSSSATLLDAQGKEMFTSRKDWLTCLIVPQVCIF